MSQFHATILLLILCSYMSQTRYIANSVSTSFFKRQNGWIFLDRMTFDEGIVEIKLNIRIDKIKQAKKQSFNGVLHIVPEDEWAQETTFKCNRKAESKNLIDQSDKNSQARILEIPLIILKSNNYAASINTQFQINETITYHFVFKDCQRSLSNQVWKRDTKLQYQLQLKNGELQHGSDQKLINIVLPLLIAVTVIMIYFSNKPQKDQFSGNNRNWPKIILYITLIFNLAALIFYWIGHLVYVAISGKFYGVFDFFYLLFHSVSQSVLTTLLIFISFGWTITFLQDAEFDLYIPLMSMLGIINLILTLLGKINDGSSDKYHMYDTIPSYLLVFFRVLTVLIFIIGIVRSISENRSNKKISDFFFKFGLFGSAYFLALPVIVIIAEMIVTSHRKIYVFVLVELAKNLVNASMTWLINSKNSNYANIKLDNRSFMQRDNKLL